MIRSELIAKLAAEHDLAITDAELVADAFFDTITKALEDRRRVELRGFGVFEPRLREARLGRNPRTGDAVEVPAKYYAIFKTGGPAWPSQPSVG